MPIIAGHYTIQELAKKWGTKTNIIYLAKDRIGITGKRHGRSLLIGPSELPQLEAELKRLGYSIQDED